MATPTNVQQNILDAMQKMAIETQSYRQTLLYITQMWTNEGVASLTDEEIQSLASFTGVTAAEALAAKNAFATILAAIGDPGETGSLAYRLLKLANNVPS